MPNNGEQGERWTIYACVEPDCDYYRDELSTVRHVVCIDVGPGVKHRVEAIEVMSVSEHQALLEQAAQLATEAIELAERLHGGDERLEGEGYYSERDYLRASLRSLPPTHRED